MQQVCRSMRQQRIPLHLAKANAAADLAALYRLPRQRVVSPDGAHLKLVLDHVAQALVIHKADEDVARHLLAGETVHHHLLPMPCETVLLELRSNVLCRALGSLVIWMIALLERGSVHKPAYHEAH